MFEFDQKAGACEKVGKVLVVRCVVVAGAFKGLEVVAVTVLGDIVPVAGNYGEGVGGWVKVVVELVKFVVPCGVGVACC